MSEMKYVMGNTAISRGALESGVRVVAGYPGTPSTEIVEDSVGYPGVHVEWSNNEKVAFELVLGASLCHVRSMAVMKHNGTNVATDFLMHVNFTGVRGGLVLISADDPGGLSSQNEEDSRILVHQYGHLPIFDPSSAQEAKERVQFGRPISSFQGVSWMMADMAVQIEAARALTYQAADMVDAEDLRKTYMSACCKLFASDVAMRFKLPGGTAT